MSGHISLLITSKLDLNSFNSSIDFRLHISKQIDRLYIFNSKIINN